MLSRCAERVVRVRTLASCLAVGAVVVLAPAGAHAHFKLNSPASWMSQDGSGGPQKVGPCAAVASPLDGNPPPPLVPTGMISVVQAGQPVSVSVTATVPHPGWYRVSLRQGASSTQTIQAFPDPPQTVAQCTPAIVMNPVWSPTQPVLADGLGLPAGSTSSTTIQSGTKTFQVQIPASANCSGAQPCSLQVIMVMTDHPANDCYYHHCADISFGGGTSDAGATTSDAATPPPRDAGASTGTGGSLGTGGNGGSGGSGTGGSGAAGAGAAGAGGSSGSGGASGTGSGGNDATGGSSGSAGSAAVGGANGGSSIGGSAGSMAGGTSAGAGGSATETDGGGVMEPPADSGGCAVALGSKSVAPWAAGLVALAALAATRRRRR